jgi:hypothetical protein
MTFSFSENFGNPFSIDKEAAVCFSQTSLHRPDESQDHAVSHHPFTAGLCGAKINYRHRRLSSPQRVRTSLLRETAGWEEALDICAARNQSLRADGWAGFGLAGFATRIRRQKSSPGLLQVFLRSFWNINGR